MISAAGKSEKQKMKNKRLKIGIVGCGAIGSSLARAIVKDFSLDAEMAAFCDIDRMKAERLSKKLLGKDLSTCSYSQLIKKVSLVIEASSSSASFELSKAALSMGRDIMIMSVGGVTGNLDELADLAVKSGGKVYIPSGAIAGIDALKASGLAKIKKVVLTTLKNPLAFKGVKFIENKGIKLNSIKKEKVLFSGTAKQAVKCFPQNINVAGVLSLAGIGQEKTYVKIIASPFTKRNIHQIEIESEAGSIFTRTENVLHPDNPKTSYLAVLSAIATLKQIFAPVKIGT